MTKSLLATAGLAAIVAFGFGARSGEAQTSVPDTDAIARTIVTQNLGIIEGENYADWGDVHFLQGATVLVDGQPLVQDGRLAP